MNKLTLKLVLAAVLGSVACASMAADAFLADRHVGRGLKCESCHNSMPPKAQGVTKQCLACHGGSYAKLAEKTADADMNPHDTHLGEIECSDCHQGHKPPRLVCDQCHEFRDMKVP